ALGEGDKTGSKGGWQPNGIVVCDTSWAWLPKIVSDGNSGAIICWSEQYRGADSVNHTTWDIYAQRVDSGGLFVWQSQGVPVCSLSASTSYYPAMVSDGYGGTIIAWEDTRDGLGYTRVFAQRLDSMGNRLWPENGVLVCNQMSGYVDLCSDGHGGAIIAYVDGRDAATSDNIYAQRIDSVGNPVWTIDGVPVCTADSIQFWPQIVSNKLGGTVITWWQDYRNGSTNNDVYAQYIDSLGIIKWSANGFGVCIEPGNQGGGQLCENNSGGAIIKWGDDSSTRVQSLDSNGVKLWDSNGVNTLGTYGSIKPIFLGGVVSNSYSAQRIDSLGNIKWGLGVLLHGDTTGGQIDATTDTFNNLFVVWDEERSSPFYSDQYIQKVGIAGNIMWNTAGVPVCTLQVASESYPKITNDDFGGAICTWHGGYPGSLYLTYPDIIAQRIYSDGTPGGVTEYPQNGDPGLRICMNAFPNPSKGKVGIEYLLPSPDVIELTVYNIMGQRVKILDKGYKRAGNYKTYWDGNDNSGNAVSSGIYFLNLRNLSNQINKKITLIR
ncbi:MAG: FlgD immunoglobulin-like domain containing protein, partial [Candidatus Zixiibacteriota bacterium]